MNGTKKFLFSLATLAAMPGFADTNGPIISSGESRLEALFKADLQYRSESESDAVVGTEGREGCLYRKWRWNGGWRPTSRNHPLVPVVRELPLSRSAERAISARGRHLCTINPSGFIETQDGARIRFDGRGYGLRNPEKYQTNLTLVFGTEDARYEWLTKVVAVMNGEFDEKTGRAIWNVYIPSEGR